MIHVYQGVTSREIDDTVEKAIYAHCNIQQKIEKKTHYSKCGEWLEYDSGSCPECGYNK